MSELSPRARELLELSGQSGRFAPPAARSRIRRALIAATVLPGTAAASASIAKLLVVGLASAALGSGLTVIVSNHNRAGPAPSTRSLAAAPQPTPPVPVPQSPTSPASPPPPAAPSVPEPHGTRTAAKAPRTGPPNVNVDEPIPEVPPAPALSKPTVPQADESLAAELEALNALVAAVEQERWNDAASALEFFHSRFREPELKVEASVLEVRVRCGQLRLEEARDLSVELRLRFPRNPSVQRLNAQNPCQKR